MSDELLIICDECLEKKKNYDKGLTVLKSECEECGKQKIDGYNLIIK